jgi:hypothetical protein
MKIIAVFVVFTIVILGSSFLPLEHYSPTLFKGFGGNLIAEIIGGLLFLVLAFYVERATKKKIDHIADVTRKSEETLRKREKELRREQLYNYFLDILKRHSYYSIRLPKLCKDGDLGLEYRIEPCRDNDGEPIKRESENFTWHLIRVTNYACASVIGKEQVDKYKDSPIRLGEHYYCEFADASWRLSRNGLEWEEFYPSGKVGPCESIESANCLMGCGGEPKDMDCVCSLYLDDKGDPVENGGCTPYKIYRNNDAELFLQVHDAPLKQLYYRKLPDRDDIEPHLVIEQFSGYLPDDEGFKRRIIESLNAEGIEIPVKVEFYSRLPKYEQEILQQQAIAGSSS